MESMEMPIHTSRIMRSRTMRRTKYQNRSFQQDQKHRRQCLRGRRRRPMPLFVLFVLIPILGAFLSPHSSSVVVVESLHSPSSSSSSSSSRRVGGVGNATRTNATIGSANKQTAKTTSETLKTESSSKAKTTTTKSVVRIVENEIWDPTLNEWKGQTPRWTSTPTTSTSTTAEGRGTDGDQQRPQQQQRHDHQQQSSSLSSSSLSPAEVNPPEGWKFQGEWKIVVNSQSQSQKNQIMNDSSSTSSISSTTSTKTTATTPTTDAMGWEYQYEYLRPPKRRRVWLRTIVQQGIEEGEEEEQREQAKGKSQSKGKQQASAVPRIPTTDVQQNTTTGSIFSVTRLIRTPQFRIQTQMLRRIQDDWNFKGLGLSLYKSVIDPTSFGFAFRLPLTGNFELFDRNPGLPSISSTLGLYGPSWTIVAGLSCSVTVEWIKWMIRHMLWSIPHAVIWLWYRFIVPLLHGAEAAIEQFIRRDHMQQKKNDQWSSSEPTSGLIPHNVRSFLDNRVSRPRYNSELSERVGCSVSYRWSHSDGFEFRVSYWHSYLPTLLLYRQLMERIQQRVQSLSAKNNQMGWWQKHNGALGVATSYPSSDPPYFSCNTQLSLSGFYFESLTRRRRTHSTKLARDKMLGKPILDNIENNADLVSSAKAAIADKMRDSTGSPTKRTIPAEEHQKANKEKMGYSTIS